VGFAVFAFADFAFLSAAGFAVFGFLGISCLSPQSAIMRNQIKSIRTALPVRTYASIRPGVASLTKVPIGPDPACWKFPMRLTNRK
jgi:hypothetical protein